MSQDHRNVRRAAMADFLQSLAELESTFTEPLDDEQAPSPEPPRPESAAEPTSMSDSGSPRDTPDHHALPKPKQA